MKLGKIVELAEMVELQTKLTNPLPHWYAELLSTYPLAGLYLDHPLYKAEDDDDGYISLKIATPRDIYSETEECYPGLAIRDLGYACFAIDPIGSGDPYFIKVADGDNPPVYQVYHDVGNTGTEIEAHGMVKIANSLTEFFDNARPNI